MALYDYNIIVITFGDVIYRVVSIAHILKKSRRIYIKISHHNTSNVKSKMVDVIYVCMDIVCIYVFNVFIQHYSQTM